MIQFLGSRLKKPVPKNDHQKAGYDWCLGSTQGIITCFSALQKIIRLFFWGALKQVMIPCVLPRYQS